MPAPAMSTRGLLEEGGFIGASVDVGRTKYTLSRSPSKPLPMDAARQLHGPETRSDYLEKVTGAAVYASDVTLPGMLHGRILRSPMPHARIRSIDASAALA